MLILSLIHKVSPWIDYAYYTPDSNLGWSGHLIRINIRRYIILYQYIVTEIIHLLCN